MSSQQFTIRDLIFSTALIAAGIALLAKVQRPPEFHWPFVSVAAYFCIPLAGSLIGAGVFLPFGRSRLGFAIGLSIAVVVMCLFAEMITPARE